MVDLYLFRSAIRELLRARRFLTAVALVALPALLAGLWRIAAPDEFVPEAVYNTLSATLVFGFLLIILSVVFGTGIVSQEIEQKTIVYLLTRPVARWRILLTRFAAAIVVITVTVWLASLLLALVAFGTGGVRGAVGLRSQDLQDPMMFANRLRLQDSPVAAYLQGRLSERTQAMLDAYDGVEEPPRRLRQALAQDVGRVLWRDRAFYDAERFAGVKLSEETRRMLAQRPSGGRTLARLNRALLEEAFPKEIAQSGTVASRLARDLAVLPIGALAYASVFLLLATLLNRPLLWGLLMAFGWETWVPSMPGNFRLVSVMTYLRALAPHPQPESESLDITQILRAFAPAPIAETTSWLVLAGVFGATLLLALLVFSFNEYVPRDDAE